MIQHNFSDNDLPNVILAVHYFYVMNHHPERDLWTMILELVESILEKNIM